VASFDPLPDAVLIWTRFTPASPAEAVAVGWQVSDRSDFGSIVAG
jgi:phosphodiesterase/alkaline phosphatase D-like protein